MPTLNDTQLTAEATAIQEQIVAGANTANVVGQMLNDLVGNKINNDKISTDTSLGNSDNLVPSQNAVKEYVDDNAGGVVFNVKVTLTSAQIKQLNTTPIVLVAAQGAAKTILPLSYCLRLNYTSPVYATNTVLDIQWAGYDFQGFYSDDILGGNASLFRNDGNQSSNTFSVAGGANAALVAKVESGNPINGNSTVDIYLTYTIIDL